MLCWRRYASVAAILSAFVVAGCGSSHHTVAEANFRYASAGLIAVSQPGASRPESAAAARSWLTVAGSKSTASAKRARASAAARALATKLDRLTRGTSAVAWAMGRPVPVYRSPNAATAEREFPTHDQFGITQVFLVKRAIPGWLEVYLPVRPNDSTAWVRSATVGVTLDPYRVVVDTAAHRLSTTRAGRAVMHVSVGIGKSATPTPHGLFYVLEELRMVPATGPYGTFAFGLSAYSNVLTTFGTGDAQVALHGTNEPATIGQSTSNGCVHLSDGVADWLARTLPLGTPVQII